MRTDLRHSAHPVDVRNYSTDDLRKAFLIEKIFASDEINLVYSMYDRLIVGGAMPVKKELKLEAADEMKAGDFLERREIGIINIGGKAEIRAGGETIQLGNKEALYLGKGAANVVFKSAEENKPAKLYFNSAPAHHSYPSRKITKADGETVVLGNLESSNHSAAGTSNYTFIWGMAGENLDYSDMDVRTPDTLK